MLIILKVVVINGRIKEKTGRISEKIIKRVRREEKNGRKKENGRGET